MYASKQSQKANTKKPLLGQKTAKSNPSFQRPLVQGISKMGNAPNYQAYADIINRAPANQQTSNRQLLLQLQQQYGNSYVGKVLQLARKNSNETSATAVPHSVVQTKLTINPAGDKYEQEANRVATDAVQRMNEPAPEQQQEEDKVAQMKPANHTIQRQQATPAPEEEDKVAQMKPANHTIQRQQATPAPEEEDKVAQMKPENHTIQRQQATPAPEEEDKVAQMKPANHTIQRQQATPAPEEEDKVAQMKPENHTIQRQQATPAPEEEDKVAQMKPLAQPQHSKNAMGATPNLEKSIQQERGKGQPLSDNIRVQMEQVFGANFSGVKIHNNTQSDQINQTIQARAFTTGQDIFFSQGAYNPQSKGGQELIAHELTHVVQQNGAAAVQRASDDELTTVQTKGKKKQTRATTPKDSEDRQTIVKQKDKKSGLTPTIPKQSKRDRKTSAGKDKDRTPSEKKQHDAKVKEGLAAIDKEETKYLKEGMIAKKDAEKVAATVKRQYPVFKKLTVIDGGTRWDYKYAASPFSLKLGRKKRNEPVRNEPVEIDGKDWKKYMDLEMMVMSVEKLSEGKQFGHYLNIKIRLYNKSGNTLRFKTPPPLEYFEEITTITTENGNRREQTTSQDQYAVKPNSNTFTAYRWKTIGQTIEPGGYLTAEFIDPPQITKTQEYKSRTVKFRIGLKGSQLRRTGLQQLTCDNGVIIDHFFDRE
jgi:hypothetical protein